MLLQALGDDYDINSYKQLTAHTVTYMHTYTIEILNKVSWPARTSAGLSWRVPRRWCFAMGREWAAVPSSSPVACYVPLSKTCPLTHSGSKRTEHGAGLLEVTFREHWRVRQFSQS